jgi:hypothetical protein
VSVPYSSRVAFGSTLETVGTDSFARHARYRNKHADHSNNTIDWQPDRHPHPTSPTATPQIPLQHVPSATRPAASGFKTNPPPRATYQQHPTKTDMNMRRSRVFCNTQETVPMFPTVSASH